MDLEEAIKKYKRNCSNCNTKFSIIFDEDTTDQKVRVCPFCSYELDEEEEDDIKEEVNENENESSWD
jgi:DNA-directed RNA polymerase subunit RPC12/RpoP